MGLDADAVAVASGEMPVVQAANALDVVEVAKGRPVPLAAHWTSGERCVVLFFIRQSDGLWRTELVPVLEGQVAGSGGGSGGILRRSDVEAGEPFIDGEGRHGIGDGMELVHVDGVSADDSVRMRCGDQVVAETTVAPHGYFVLAAVLPTDAEVTVEPGSAPLG